MSSSKKSTRLDRAPSPRTTQQLQKERASLLKLLGDKEAIISSKNAHITLLDLDVRALQQKVVILEANLTEARKTIDTKCLEDKVKAEDFIQMHDELLHASNEVIELKKHIEALKRDIELGEQDNGELLEVIQVLSNYLGRRS